MSDKTWIGGTLIDSGWLQDVNNSTYRDVANVKRYGATGDGSTDDTAAFTAAIASGASTIYVPAGNYVITSKITLASAGLRLVGAGRNLTSILADFRGGAVVEITASRCSITDLAISTKASSSRRLASPFGKVAPDATVDGNSSDYGILINQEANVLTYTHIDRVDIAYQPATGLVMGGAGSGTVISQVSVTSCGGHGMYFDDGTYIGDVKSRNGIVDVRDCVIQDCWGHGVDLASSATLTVFRFNLHNLDIFNVCNGDGGVNQPAFYSATKAAIAVRAQNTQIRQCGVTSENGIIIGNSVDIVIESCRFVSCTTRGVLVNPNCSRIRIIHPYFTSVPTTAFRIQSGCDNTRIEGVVSSELSGGVIIDSDNETVLYVDGKLCKTVSGSNSLWYSEEIVQQTISSGTCNIQSGIVDIIGEGDVVDSVSTFRFVSGVAVPNGYRFVVSNFRAYNISILDISTGGAANINVQGTTAVLEPGESLEFIAKDGVYYAIGREIP